MERILPTHIVAGAGIVLNEKDEVLLVKARHGGWVFPGGQVEAGENVPDAVKREVLEETGVEIDVGELFCVSSNTGTHPGYNGVKVVPTKVMLDFICQVKGGVPRPSEENDESAFFPKAEALALIHTPSILERYKAYLEYAGRPTYLEYVTYPSFQLRVKRMI